MSSTDGHDSLRRALQSAVGSQYEIIRLLGRGGMGAVYLARDTLERLVAIKVILPHAFDVPGARERFRKEMRTVARFTHPNIIPIYDSGQLEELDYFVMMYVSGDDIADRLRQEGRMPPEEVRRILVDLADALYYAHGLGVIHRDVKPANVMIDDMTGRVFLTDFGVAKTVNSGNTTGTVAGTLGYMPPEAINGARIDHRADIYSLGVLGYEMLTGRRPFNADHPVQQMHHTVNTPPPELSSLAPDVPPDLEAVVMRCLAKDPNERARDARQLRSALGVKETDEATMPEDLRDMAGFGSWAVLWATVWGTFGVLNLGERVLGITLLVIALAAPIAFGMQVVGIRPAGLSALQIARVAFWPPKWWGMWWPRRLRRPVDLWPRLPGRARLTRIALSAFFVVVPLLIFLATGNDATLPSVLPALWLTIGVFAAGVTGVLIDAWLWGRRQELDGREIFRVFIGPTIVSQIWDSPKVSRLLTHRLLPFAPDVAKAPDYPRDCLEKIKRIAQALTGSSREAGAMAVSAARELSGEIEILDVEISELTHDGDSQALARLTKELADSPANTREDSIESRMRRPLVKELERLRDIDLRLSAATRDRVRLFEIQLSVWDQLVSLSRLDPDDGAAEALRTRIRGLCAGL